MSSRYSTEAILKQLSSGIFSGSVIGILIGRSQHLIAYLTFTSIGLIDAAYHLNYLEGHITHLDYDRSTTRRDFRSRFTNLQRDIQREIRDAPDDFDQEIRWIWNDIKRYIDRHIYYGMGFTLAFVLSVVLTPKIRR